MVSGERVKMRDEEMDAIRGNQEMKARVKSQILRAKRLKSIDDVLEEVSVLIDTKTK